MDKILLISQDPIVRQLYHELLLSKSTEIIPVDDLSRSILNMSIDHYSFAIIDGMHVPELEIVAFLRLRRNKPQLQKTSIILIVPEADNFAGFIFPTDTIIVTRQENVTDTITTIQKIFLPSEK